MCSRSAGAPRGSRAAPPSTRSSSTGSSSWWPHAATRSGSRNLRASGEGLLLSRGHSESFTAVEVPDAEKPEILRAYLKRWKFEVGVFFDGIGPDSPEPELLAAAPKHPVFRLSSPAR